MSVKLAATAALLNFLLTQTAPAQITQQHLSAIYDSLAHPSADADHALLIRNATFAHGGQSVNLSEGTLTPFLRVNGHMFGAYYTGKGTFTVAPPTPLEQKEFERRTSNS